MWIVIKNPPTNPAQFSSVLPSVVQNVYEDAASAQADSMTLAAANPGDVYAVFNVVLIGSAVVVVAPVPPPSWIPFP